MKAALAGAWLQYALQQRPGCGDKEPGASSRSDLEGRLIDSCWPVSDLPLQVALRP
jgi:hypothetical protein